MVTFLSVTWVITVCLSIVTFFRYAFLYAPQHQKKNHQWFLLTSLICFITILLNASILFFI